MGLDSRDYERMLDVATAILHTHQPERLWPWLAEELLESLHGTAAIHKDEEWTENRGTVHAWTSGGVAEVDPRTGRHVRIGLPFPWYMRGDALCLPATGSEILGPAWYDGEAADRAREAFDADDVLGLPVASQDGVVRGFLVYHRAEDFTDRERAYAERIQPLLAGADAQSHRLRRWRSSVSESEERAAEYRLTPREVVVLGLLAEALPAVAIARRLGVSVRTVHKHVQNVYRKLGTSDRVSTILRAQWAGLIASGARTPHDARHPATSFSGHTPHPAIRKTAH
ncbi:response regulator transcription factor [Amycolatopsis rhizosphaerae]|uniref:Response regulator transcription factor n=1 Tax=Amycolatopsis rhizosphaerae TaxID=2053003 RepID=A0A558CXW5_9PSEU|nr:LuxR C-terminal-related transcriptional regulator [Amycolatopsis rhizosphaerae]TVT53618.1 response regulator transcription factor [Amycolatopsis rhizosphaerae]